MSIPELTTGVPTLSDEANFDTNFDGFMNWIPAAVVAMNVTEANVNAKELLVTQQATIAAAKAVEAAQSALNATNNGAAQVSLATIKANESSASAASALNSRNEIAGLITLLPTDVNLAYSKAAIDSKLELRDLENFLEFKF